MKHDIPVRIMVLRPLAGVAMKVQSGRCELLDPLIINEDSIGFEFEMTVDLGNGQPNFLGKYAQGLKDARFIYVNSGTYAGQADSCWARRAKISLMSVTAKQVQDVLSNLGARLETSFPGTGGRDSGPTCASVKGIEWKVINR